MLSGGCREAVEAASRVQGLLAMLHASLEGATSAVFSEMSAIQEDQHADDKAERATRPKLYAHRAHRDRA